MRRPRVESNVDWIGSIPAEWELVPLGRVFRERRSTVSDADYEPLSVCMAGIVPRMENVALTSSGDNRKLVRAGDYVINSRSDRKGSGGLSPMDGSVSVISTVLRPVGIEPQFAHHLLRSTGFQEEFYRWGSGIVADLWSTRYDKMSKIALPLPPLAEQVRIADFLDRETAKIDTLIKKQNALIERLRERREVAIQRMLQPHPVMPLKRLVDPARPMTYGILQAGPPVADGVPYVGPSDIPGEGVSPRLHDLRRTAFEIAVVYRRSTLKKGDVVASIGPAYGRVMIASEELAGANLTQDTVRVALLPARADAKFVVWVLGSLKAHEFWDRQIAGATFRRLNLGTLGETPIPLPSLSEQRDIADRLDRETAKVDMLISKAERFVELARERRAALITAAVTGQLEVEGAA